MSISKKDCILDPKVECLKSLYVEEKEEKKLTYIIPGYQRPYEWTEKQLESLWNTIIGCNIKEIDPDEMDSYREAFIDSLENDVIFGTLQFNRIERTDGISYEVIDGQQRLTTFWILLELLESFSPSSEKRFFQVNNKISDKYVSFLHNVTENVSKGAEDRYSKNYVKLKSLFNNHLQFFGYDESEIPQITSMLRDKILDHVLFVVVYTSFEGSISKTIEIFNSLNTTGLDLATKDVFKIRYYDFLVNCGQEDKKEIESYFPTVNRLFTECTEIVGLPEAYHLSVDDLIDTFRLYTICKNDSKTDLAKKAKSTPQTYFVDNKSSILSSYIKGVNDFKTFIGICESIKRVQELMFELDRKESDGIITYCSRELLTQSGYWCFRNLFFVFVYAQVSDKTNENAFTDSINKDTILTALKMSEIVWKVCSVARMSDSKIVNQLLKGIPEKIVIPFLNTPLYSDSYLLEARKLLDGYIGESEEKYLETPEVIKNIYKAIMTDAYNCHLRNLLVSLSYLNDYDISSNKKSRLSIKSNLFYQSDKNKKYDVEHIASYEFFNECNLVNHIGNLVYLSYSVNRGLGKRTGKINDSGKTLSEKLVEDFTGKVDKNRGYNNYRDECDNVSVDTLLSVIDNQAENYQEEDHFDVYGLISERSKRKQAFLYDIFKCVLQTSEKEV